MSKKDSKSSLKPIKTMKSKADFDGSFRGSILHTPAFQKLMAKMLGIADHTRLEVKQALPTEMHSRQIADALHGNDAKLDSGLKNLRADGFHEMKIKDFKPGEVRGIKDDGRFVLECEVQGKRSSGMLVRAFLYNVAFRENQKAYQDVHIVNFMLLTGKNHLAEYRKLHGNFKSMEVSLGIIDLEQIKDEDFEVDSVWDQAVRLNRTDILDERSYIETMRLIADADIDETQRGVLLGLVTTAIGKLDQEKANAIAEEIVKMNGIDPKIVERAYKAFEPHLEELERKKVRAEGYRSSLLEDIQYANAPTFVEEYVSSLDGQELLDKRAEIKAAIRGEDWAFFGSALKLG